MIAPLLLAFLAVPRAGAYELMGYVWTAEDLPIQWYMTDYAEDSLENASSYGYADANDYQAAMITKSFANWYDAECAEISDAYMGIDPGNEGKVNDGINKIYFDDPTGYYGAGILAVAASNTSGEFVRDQDGEYLYRFSDVDIVFNDDVDWALSEEIEQDGCSSSVSVEGVATHELGHLWGLGHSCDEGESCTDEALRYATMYWQYTDPCSLEQASINSDDIAGINALYGPYATFRTTSERFGGVPLTVDFQLVAGEDVNITGTEWMFGDGSTSTERDPTHTYDTQGQFTVVLHIDGQSDSCGAWSYDYRERAYVVACEVPGPGLSPEGEQYPGLFTYEHLEGLQYQMVNRVDTSVYGCLDTVVWQVYQGESLVQEISAWSPIVEFPSEGAYRVVLNVGGPGGMSAAELTVDAAATAGGCNAVPLPGVGLGAILAGLGLGVARRRRPS